MSDLAEKLEAARERVTVEWTAERARRVERAIAVRQGVKRATAPRGTWALRGWAGAAAVVAFVTLSIAATAGVIKLARRWRAPEPQVVSAPVSSEPSPMTASKPRGQGTSVEVTAERATDRVPQPVPSEEVAPSKEGLPGAKAAPLFPAAEPAGAIGPTATQTGPVLQGAANARWRKEAHDGDFDAAYRTLKASGMASSVKDEPGDLLLAADVARLSGHPEAALAPLQQLLQGHRDDPRAPLAAFTLGRVLLDELGRPAEAAAAFRDARSLGAGGPLEEDALAREVEATSRAGDTDGARTTAEEYLRRYPDGRRVRAVRKFGGVE